MAEKSKQSNINNEYNVASTGLNLDNSQNNIKKGALSYALNAALENFDSNSTQYQNEPGNELCFEFPDGYKLIGKHFIPEQNKVIFMITNPDIGGSEIGFMVDNDCEYRTLVNDPCLNFDINRPILSVVHKITNFGTEIYWADNNGRRYLDIDNVPYLPLETSDACNITPSSRLDCNKLLLQPDLNIPLINVESEISGGDNKSGTYQFTIQYADIEGNPYTSFYGVTNPAPIADVNVASVNFDFPVGKSLVVNVTNLNPLGQYQYFNLVVIKTVNNISTPELVGTYFIDDTFKKITYTGQVQTNIRLTMNDVFEKYAFYDNADYVTTVQDILIWKGVTATERISYQKIANEIKLQWQSYRIPSSEDYSDAANASNYRGYLRDEVYAFEIVFLLANGKETDGFHIPGRAKGQIENTYAPVDISNPDFIGVPDEGTTTTPYWKVYNTATVEATNSEYSPTDDYKGPYQFGDFAYWESTEEYPCDEEIWGTLAGEKIRHHKFPDVLVSPIIESSVEAGLIRENVAIFPLGVRIDTNQIQLLIEKSDLTSQQKDEIIGYKIVRGDRGVNKSIIAKGILRNVGEYSKDDQTFYFPNYPYNDLSQDPFLNKVNNAWTAECEPFELNIFSLPESDDDGPYLEIEYISCTNNKLTTEKFRELGKFEVPAMSKPKVKSPGVVNEIYYGTKDKYPQVSASNIATVNYKYYDIWELKSGGTAIQACSGWRAAWSDDYMSDEPQEHWIGGFGGEAARTRIAYVQVGTIPSVIQGEGNCGIERNLIGTTKPDEEETVFEETPLDSIESSDVMLANRQIFNSPETSFGQPFLGTILKLESVIYGGGKAHFVPVRDNAKYKLLTKEAQQDALKAAEDVADLTSTPSLEAMFSVYSSYTTTYINGITRKNYAYSFNSIASYNYSKEIPNNLGIKQRNLDIKRYLTPDILSVGEDNDIIINNYNRETSVYLRADSETPLPFPHKTQTMIDQNIVDSSRFTIGSIGNCAKPQKEEDISVVSYYASLKNDFVNQYGQIYSYNNVDTGFVKLFDVEDEKDDIIFGGDTFIGRFAFKTKVPFFFDDRVNAPNDSDIFYDEIGNIAYPKYWHSSRSILENYNAEKFPLSLTNFISYKAHNFDCPNDQALSSEDADPSTNPDRTFYDGYMYLYAYGIPSFYCESSYNLDLRTAFNNKEGDFWPHVSTGIPDEWLQETNVSILNDNTYNYNVTYSKQNKETVTSHLPFDWGTGENRTEYPFRAVYSDPQITDADNRVNNWLTYRPISYFDFPQNYGDLVALDGLKNRAILARFENKSLMYNSLLTIDTSNPQAAYVGNDKLFSSAPPIDFAETDQGYVGTQNKMLLKTPYGAVSIDAKRGQVFLINGTQLEDLTMYGTGMNRWFTAHLPFEITKYFKDVDTDNHFNGVGLHGVYDTNYERVIITKLDYVPLEDNITYENGTFYVTENSIKKEVFLTDSDYFCNVSWTLSFNFNSKSWISFHSYIPNWYVGENNFYYSGLNYCTNDFDVLVGVMDLTPPTTTTTTTIPLTTTTSTTIPEVLPDCEFDVSISIPDCTLEGEGVFIGDEPEEPCQREDTVYKGINLYVGYTLESPVIDNDTTGSQEDACVNLGYFNLYGTDDANYTPTAILVDMDDYSVGVKIYDYLTSPDCTVVPDGWYFNAESAEANEAFEVVNGIITQIVTCGLITTTTTTTTLLPTDTYCYIGVYATDDPVHPLGGAVTYIDATGTQQVQDGIFVESGTVQIEASSIVSAIGVHDIVCP